MAKKKDGSESNLGLIITLVIFVLLTIILGVTTYMGFSAQEEKDKAVAKMKQEKDDAEARATWGYAKTRILRAIIDGKHAPGDDAARTALEKQQIDSGTFPAAAKQSDKDDFVGYTKALAPTWDAGKSTAPPKTLEQILREKDQRIEAEKARARVAEEKAAREKRDREEAELEAEKTITSLKNAMEDVKKRALEDRKTDLAALSDQGDTLRKENEEYQKLRDKYAEAEKMLNRLEAQNKKLVAELADAKRALRTVSEERDTKELQLVKALEQLGKPRDAIEDAVKDARYAQLIREWKKDWKIVELDRKGSMVYINLGSADRLVPQLTFSIHGVGLDGQLNPQSKGTLEVVRVLGSNLALARITSERESASFKKDPIVRGDRLFNPAWDPDRKRHVAIAGLADLGGEGIDNTEDLRRMLNRQNIEVDAYIDVSDEKAPRLEGRGITSKTDYLILADALDAINHPKANDKTYMAAYQKLEREMKAKAVENGVTVIPLRRYLDMVGYTPPKVFKPIQGR